MGDCAVTVTLVDVKGDWNGAFRDRIVYLRVWRDSGEGRWLVAAGQATRVLED